MTIESIKEHDPGYVTSIRKINLCLFLVVLLEIEDLVCEIDNVIVKIVMKTVICVYFSFLVSLLGLRAAFGRPRCVLLG